MNESERLSQNFKFEGRNMAIKNRYHLEKVEYIKLFTNRSGQSITALNN